MSLSTDNLDVIKYVASLEALYFSPRPVFKAKDEAEAIKQRTLGNEAFAKRDLQKAFLHYTVSVIKAEHPLIGEKVQFLSLSRNKLNLFLVQTAIVYMKNINLSFFLGFKHNSGFCPRQSISLLVIPGPLQGSCCRH